MSQYFFPQILKIVAKEFASQFREKFWAMQFLFSDFDSLFKIGAKLQSNQRIIDLQGKLFPFLSKLLKFESSGKSFTFKCQQLTSNAVFLLTLIPFLKLGLSCDQRITNLQVIPFFVVVVNWQNLMNLQVRSVKSFEFYF